MAAQRNFEGYTVVLTPENLPIDIFVSGNDAPWMEDSACKDADPKDFDVDTLEDAAVARAICAECPVALRCLEYAIANDLEGGVWGGATHRQRVTMTRRGKIVPNPKPSVSDRQPEAKHPCPTCGRVRTIRRGQCRSCGKAGAKV